ncbi:MAG: aspartate aminotransferase family protein [Phycisphaeraceae bacterium]|nr:aspartate aminotransferase family protein [Phycisphaeraceae bacterium]
MPTPSDTKAAELIRRRDRVVCPGVGRLSDLTAASADGATLTDADGREYIDFAGGIGVMNIGHNDPAVVAAINDQASRLVHTGIHVATYEPYVALCERLVELLPHHEPGTSDSTKAMLVNTGAEAVENSIKIARQATGRAAVICFTGAFHGRTLLAATLTSKVGYKAGCGPFMPEVYRLPFPVVRRGQDEAPVVARELARLRAALKNTVAPRDLAAIIVEPVQGEGGFHVLPGAYAKGLRDICDEHGITLIFDEVQTGFGRTGKWGAFEHLGVRPDLSPWAKSMGGGLPISAVVGKASVMDRVTPGTLGGTYGGNPVACAAALATIGRMEELGLNAKATRDGRTIRARFESIANRVPAITDVRGLGAMLAIEFSVGGDPDRPDGPGVAAIIATCRDKGLLVIPAGVDSNAIRVLAPLVIDDATLARGLDILEAAILQHAAPKPAAPAPAHATQGA